MWLAVEFHGRGTDEGGEGFRLARERGGENRRACPSKTDVVPRTGGGTGRRARGRRDSCAVRWRPLPGSGSFPERCASGYRLAEPEARSSLANAKSGNLRDTQGHGVSAAEASCGGEPRVAIDSGQELAPFRSNRERGRCGYAASPGPVSPCLTDLSLGAIWGQCKATAEGARRGWPSVIRQDRDTFGNLTAGEWIRCDVRCLSLCPRNGRGRRAP